MQYKTDGTQIINVDGDPETVYAANPGSLGMDSSNGALYLKVTGTGNTGWERIESGTDVATTYQANSGSATPASNILNVFGTTGIPGTSPVVTSASGNTVSTVVQISQALSAADSTKIGLSNFDSTSFNVTSTGFVTLVGGGFTWNDVSGAFSPLASNGYFVTGTATGTLPASPSQGDTIKFFVDHASQDLTIQAAGSQLIRLGTLVSSAGGTAVSTAQGDSLTLVFRSSDDQWCAVGGFSGTWVMA